MSDKELIEIAIVILNFNGKHFIERFLQIVIDRSPSAEVIIADNASTDGSVRYLEKEFPRIRCIQFDKNYGYAGGYQKALQEIEASYYILLNSDVEVAEGWLPPLMSFMERNPSAAAIQPKILAYDRPTYFEYAGAAGGFLDKLGYPFCRGRIFDTVEPDMGQYDDIAEVFWASGCCMVVRAEAFHKVGGLDPDFFAHMEEIDLCWRFWRFGYTVHYVPQSVIYHVGGGTLPIKSPFKTRLNFRNSALCLIKNLPERNVWLLTYAKLIIDGVAALNYAMQGKFNFVGAIFKGHRQFFKMRKKTYAKRVGQSFEVPERIIDSRSIVWDYFVVGKKYYSNLKKVTQRK